MALSITLIFIAFLASAVAQETDPWLAAINGVAQEPQARPQPAEFDPRPQQQQQQQQFLPGEELQRQQENRRQDLGTPIALDRVQAVPPGQPAPLPKRPVQPGPPLPQRPIQPGPPPQQRPVRPGPPPPGGRGQIPPGGPFQRPLRPPPNLRRPPPKEKPQGILDGIGSLVGDTIQGVTCTAQSLYAEDKLKDPNFINSQFQCLLGKGECDETGLLIKRMAPDILRGGCPPPCDPCKKKQIQKVMATLSRKYPKQFQKLIQQFGG